MGSEMCIRDRNHIDELEAEAIFILREVASKFDNPVLLFSGGKDSIVLTHLAKKAFYPAQIPFKLLHVDTGHNFPETLEFRDNLISKMNLDLVVGYVQDSINKDPSIEEKGANASRNSIQTITLLEMIDKYNFDVAIGGARRDEEKSRAKERFFSHRENLDNGVQKIKDQNFGVCLILTNLMESILEYSLFQIGQS